MSETTITSKPQRSRGALNNSSHHEIPLPMLSLPIEDDDDVRELKKWDKRRNFGIGSSSSSSTSDVEEDITTATGDGHDGRPVCNVWKGENHPIHVVGQFDSQFEKDLKKYQVPKKISVHLDPFCRSGMINYESGDPPIKDAFLVWEHGSFGRTPSKLSQDVDDASSETDNGVGDGDDLYNPDSDSDTDPTILDYIQDLQAKKSRGENVSQEQLFYDPDFDAVRNLHRDSISMTNYGKFEDAKLFGKLFDTLSKEEQKMLQATPVDDVAGKGQMKAPSSKANKEMTNPKSQKSQSNVFANATTSATGDKSFSKKKPRTPRAPSCSSDSSFLKVKKIPSPRNKGAVLSTQPSTTCSMGELALKKSEEINHHHKLVEKGSGDFISTPPLSQKPSSHTGKWKP